MTIALNITRSSKTTLLVQLVNGLKVLVETGQLEGGEKLPPTRILAQSLGISRATVVAAFEQLEAEGFVVSKNVR